MPTSGRTSWARASVWNDLSKTSDRLSDGYRERKSPVLDPSTEGFCARIPFEGDGGARGADLGWIQIRALHAERGSGLGRDGGSCGESRASGLWGTRRGGRGTDGRRHASGKRGLLALLVLALAAPLSAAATAN